MPFQLHKISRSGRLMNTWDFATLEEIGEFLKQPLDIIEQIRTGHIFPKGKQCILNKFTIRIKVEKPPEKIGLVDFR